MSQEVIRDNVNRFLFRFKNLTSLNVPTGFLGSILDNEKLYKMSPKRFNFYLQVIKSITSPNTDILEKVLEKENLSRYQREQIDEKLNNILDYFQYKSVGEVSNYIPKMNAKLGANMLTQEHKVVPSMGGGAGEQDAPTQEDLSKRIDQLKKKLFPYRTIDERQNNSLTHLFDTESNSQIRDKEQEKNVANARAEALQASYREKEGKGVKETQEKLEAVNSVVQDVNRAVKEQDIDLSKNVPLMAKVTKALEPSLLPTDITTEQIQTYLANTQKTLADKLADQEREAKIAEEKVTEAMMEAGKQETQYRDLVQKEKNRVIRDYRKDPSFSPDNEKVTWTDRTIFIALTYIIRAVSLFLMEWAIYSGFIKSFTNAFALYFGMYTCIFLLLVFLTNGRSDDMIFRMLFFYINTQSDDGRGTMRILVHMICILMLLPIPYIVKEYREFQKTDIMTFQDKTNILNGVEKFSLYSWLLTTIVAINV